MRYAVIGPEAAVRAAALSQQRALFVSPRDGNRHDQSSGPASGQPAT
jgi:hypothetical protein